jgi:hypothetical protein
MAFCNACGHPIEQGLLCSICAIRQAYKQPPPLPATKQPPPLQTTAGQKEPVSARTAKGCFMMIGFAIATPFVVAFIYLLTPESAKESERGRELARKLEISEAKDKAVAAQPSANPAEPEPIDCRRTGSICKLKSLGMSWQGVDWVPSTADAETWETLRMALKADDTDGISEVILTGKVFLTKAGDEVRVLDFSVWNNRTEVRFLSGFLKGKRAFTMTSWVVPR